MATESYLEQIVSSGPRLTIAALLSQRPRCLQELSAKTGISIQGVLKHIAKLQGMGLVQWTTLEAGVYLRPRKLYFIRGKRIDGVSREGLILAHLSNQPEVSGARPKDVYNELEGFAEEVLFLRRRISEQSRKLERMLDELAMNEFALNSIVAGLSLTEEERQVAMIIFTESSLDDRKSVLSEYYGCVNSAEAVKAVESTLKKRGAK
jgi:predicted transcriptional regulator